jgi:23S rRNA (uridine2552-2'-O)-methyltransferase
MAKRSKSSARWLAEHRQDPFVQRAQKEGWRSRAVYKLAELDAAERLLKPGMTVIDLGAAPGGWSQYAARAVQSRGRVFALDLLPMDDIPGVEVLVGDFREEAVLASLATRLGGDSVDLVMSDMAPNMAGVDVIDQARQMHLVELALDFALKVVRPGGSFLAKLFQGAGFQELVRETRRHFSAVKLKKPQASRARSAEMYLLATGRRMV